MSAEETTHKHKLVYLGRLSGEYGGSYPLYQCGGCGATFEQFSGVKYAVFYPEMTAHVATLKEEIEFVKSRSARRSKPQTRVLGRGLVELMTRKSEKTPLKGLDLLLGGKKDV